MKTLGFVSSQYEDSRVYVLSTERLWSFNVCKRKTIQFVSVQEEDY